MTTVSRRFTFIVDDGVQLDVEDVLRQNPAEAAAILAAVEDLKGDRLLCERLIEIDYEDDTIRSVKEFVALQRRRYNAYTVRLYEVDNWRLITAVDHRQMIIALLYIMRRDEDYDGTAQKRVIEAFDRLGLRQLGG
jgi:hypothetical protein